MTQRLASAEWLTSGPLGALLATLDFDGEEARVVGGAVRDVLLGEQPREIDIATTALPQEVTRRANVAGFKSVPTGVEHGTVTVVVDNTPFEVTTLRSDVETFGRRATVRFGRDWNADAKRRDFTINALSVGRDSVVHDFVGGIADLRARRVRFIGDAATRIAEDYLRVLRFFRFHATYAAGAPDAHALHASIAARDGLELLSRERIRAELMKLLVAPRATDTVEVMGDSGLLGLVLGGAPLLVDFAAMIGIERAMGLAADPVRRLGALAVLVTEDADRLRERLRLSNTEHERLLSMAESWWRVSPPSGEQAARALLYRLGPGRFVDRALLAWSRSTAESSDEAWRRPATLPQRWTAPKMPFSAGQFVARGVREGSQLGAALRAAEGAWIAADFPSDPAALNRLADEAVNLASTPQGATSRDQTGCLL